MRARLKFFYRVSEVGVEGGVHVEEVLARHAGLARHPRGDHLL